MNNFKAIVLAFVAISAATAVRGESLECPTICPDSYVPTCGTDGTEYAQFDNPCALKVFNCKRQRSTLPDYAETDIDWCTTTELDELSVDLLTDLDEADPSCRKACPMIFSPLCGSNGTYRKVFSNQCEMDMFNCINKSKDLSNWRILKQGMCTQNTDGW